MENLVYLKLKRISGGKKLDWVRREPQGHLSLNKFPGGGKGLRED